MATVIADMSMSLDGFVADTEDRTDQVFGWYFGGDTPVPTANPHFTFQVSKASAKQLREAIDGVGALISGRRTFADSGKPIYVGIYTSFRHDDRGYVSVGFPIPSANFTATLEPRNGGEDDLLLTSRSNLAFPGHYLSSVDRDRDALTVLKLLSFHEEIHVYVADGQLRTDHSFSLAGQPFLTLRYEIERLVDGAPQA